MAKTDKKENIMSKFDGIVIIGLLLLIPVGAIFAGIRIHDQFTVKNTVSGCTVTDTNTTFVKFRTFSLNTSCGSYSTDKVTYDSVVIGQDYTFDVSGSMTPSATLVE